MRLSWTVREESHVDKVTAQGVTVRDERTGCKWPTQRVSARDVGFGMFCWLLKGGSGFEARDLWDQRDELWKGECEKIG